MKTPPGDTVQTVDVPPRDLKHEALPRPAVALGSVIGSRYRLIELLGVGGMGQVYLAENMAIGMPVAIKVLKPELMADPVFQTRFQREARAIASINHPNVVRFLDLVLGEPTFLVMELVRGPSLKDHLKKQGALGALQAVSIAERLALALSAVHAGGVIHRDLKPGNIVLEPDRELGLSPKIIDFGVVRFAAAGEGLQVTRVGQLVGTLHYMAPEQISTGAVQGSADLYALGSVLFHMLDGHPMFDDSVDEGQLLYNVVHRPPPALRGADQLPPRLRALLASLLAKRPEDRPKTADEVAAELRRIRWQLQGGASGALPVATPPRARPGRLLAVGLLGAVLAGAAFFTGRRSAGTGQDHQDRGLIAVDSQPRGASILIDGKPWGETTPTAVTGLAAGSHTVTVSLANHTPAVQTVNLGERGRDAISLVLAPNSRLVEIQTMPRDATVYVNGQLLVQRTPTRISVTEDEFYQLRLERVGYQTATARITPEDHDPVLRLTLDPETQSRGVVLVDSNSAARVFVDGADSGYTTPTLGMLLPEGPHTIQLQSGNARSAIERINLRAGGTQRVLLDLLPARR